MKNRPIELFTENDETLAAIPLGGKAAGKFAILFKEDLDSLEQYGVRPNWFLNNGYVAVKLDGQVKYVHRLLAAIKNSGRLQFSFRDGNPLNLRRTNLESTSKDFYRVGSTKEGEFSEKDPLAKRKRLRGTTEEIIADIRQLVAQPTSRSDPRGSGGILSDEIVQPDATQPAWEEHRSFWDQMRDSPSLNAQRRGFAKAEEAMKPTAPISTEGKKRRNRKIRDLLDLFGSKI
ncbi:hypothetical protein [Hyphomicrobium sp.]|uniref:hypothetical protein n=1 Tax=Hyphomicrobium sp. TaxID=82 RepID=UPI000F912B29|nr:hypothetical protein [Hyphomicrobium sp.]RUP00120.1 MAG: hypothetical protein EKK30_03120 [Hyphomicrobium sp.]